MSDQLIDARILAMRLGLSIQALANYRLRGKGPKFIRIGRTIRYREADIREWLTAGLVNPSSNSPSENP